MSKGVGEVHCVANPIRQILSEGCTAGVLTVRDPGHIAIDLEGELAVTRLEQNATLDGLA